MSAWATQVGLVMFLAMIVLMAVRMPIAAAMFIPGVFGYWLMTDSAATLNFLKGNAVARLTVYELSVIPLFLLMGQFASQGGLSRDLFKAASALVGHVRGGLAMASLLSAGAFGAVCGSSVATSATITQVAYPHMKSHGYSGRLATATLATGALSGFALASVVLGRGYDPFRMASIGAWVGIPAFLAVIASASMQSTLLFALGTGLIGLGSGLFGHGTLTATMQAAPPNQTGLALGTWGAVQATAAGLAIALGGMLRDVVASMSTPVMGYTAVYALEVVLLIATIVAMVPLLRRNPPPLSA